MKGESETRCDGCGIGAATMGILEVKVIGSFRFR